MVLKFVTWNLDHKKTIVFRGFGKAMPLRRRMTAGSTQMDCDAAKATIVPIGTSSDRK